MEYGKKISDVAGGEDGIECSAKFLMVKAYIGDSSMFHERWKNPTMENAYQ